MSQYLILKWSKKSVSYTKKRFSVSDISKQLGFSKGKVLRLMKLAGLKSRPKMAHAEKDRLLKHGKQSALPYYGFCYFEGRVTKDPKEFPTLQIIYSRFGAGKTIQEIVLELNRKKLPSRKGKSWSWAAVQNIVNRIKDKKLILKTGGDYELR